MSAVKPSAVLDSSAWISYWNEEPRALSVIDEYARKLERVIVPSLVIYELQRQLLKRMSEADALPFVKQLGRGLVVACDETIALQAAALGRKHQLGTADAIILATARSARVELITFDYDFRGIDHCRVLG